MPAQNRILIVLLDYSSRVAVDFLRQQGVIALLCSGKCPDMSPIEHMVARCTTDPIDQALPREIICHIIASMPRRCYACIIARGTWTSYLSPLRIKNSEYDQEIPHHIYKLQTNLWHVMKSHTSITRHQEDKQSKATFLMPLKFCFFLLEFWGSLKYCP